MRLERAADNVAANTPSAISSGRMLMYCKHERKEEREGGWERRKGREGGREGEKEGKRGGGRGGWESEVKGGNREGWQPRRENELIEKEGKRQREGSQNRHSRSLLHH